MKISPLNKAYEPLDGKKMLLDSSRAREMDCDYNPQNMSYLEPLTNTRLYWFKWHIKEANKLKIFRYTSREFSFLKWNFRRKIALYITALSMLTIKFDNKILDKKRK